MLNCGLLVMAATVLLTEMAARERGVGRLESMHIENNSTAECGTADLISAIGTYLATHQELIAGAGDILAQISMATINMNFCENKAGPSSKQMDFLRTAINNISERSLEAIRECLICAMSKLIWRQDEDEYYASESELGDGYRETNLHTLLIGPTNAKYYRPDFTLGIFLLGPFTLYRDHFHLAPELYVNLSPRTGWRFQGGEWNDFSAGSLIWNNSNDVHATRVYEDPFISIFSWTRNISSPCRVFACEDWKRLELELNKLRARNSKKADI